MTNTETIHDVAKWLDIALKAVFLDAESLKARGHKPFSIKLDEANTPNGDDDSLPGTVEIDEQFYIYKVATEDIYESLGGRSHKPVIKWRLDGTKVYPGSRWEPPSAEPIELGEFHHASQVATELVKLLIIDRLNGVMESAAYALEEEERKRLLGEVF